VIDLTYEVLATGAPAELRLAIGGPG